MVVYFRSLKALYLLTDITYTTFNKEVNLSLWVAALGDKYDKVTCL